MNRHFYTALLWLVLPLIPLRLLWRARREPAYRQHWAERFGYYSKATLKAAPLDAAASTNANASPTAASTLPSLIWLHSVSVGETRAAETLVRALLQRGHTLLLTHMTPGGREAAQQLFEKEMRIGQVQSVYLPYDYPSAIARFLRHFQPRLGVLMETEAWPNLVAQCQRAGLPLALVNARLSAKSAAQAHGLGRLAREAAQGLSLVAAQTDADAQRLAALGASTPVVTGNLKFDAPVKPELIALGQSWRAHMGKRPVLLLASTRELGAQSEEALWLHALKALSVKRASGNLDAVTQVEAVVDVVSFNAAAGAPPHLPPDLLIVIVPRHPQRFNAVAELAQRLGWRVQRRSDAQPIAPNTQVWLGDSMGEMGAYFTLGELAFIGGSLLPLGGQNLIEAAAYGCPTLIGEHTFNFSQASEQALEAGAARRIHSAEEGVAQALALFAQPTARQTMCEAAARFCQQHQGATQRTLQALQTLLTPSK